MKLPTPSPLGRRGRSSRVYPAAAGLAAFALHAATAARTVTLGDSGELIAAAHALGVAHPPGYPLYVVLGKLALLVPLGEPAWRMSLLSAFFAAIACGLVARLVQRWSGSSLAALAAALALAAWRDLWAVATVAEVYTLHLALIGALLLAADRAASDAPRERRIALIAAGLLVGLGLAHRPTILLALPAAALLAWRPGARRGGFELRDLPAPLALALALPLLAYGGMMLRAAAEPVANWGRPDDPATLWAHVTARSFRYYVVGPSGWLQGQSWSRLAGMLGSGTGFVGALAALCGVGATLRQPGTPRRRVAALLLLGAAFTLFGHSYGTDDAEVLYLPLLLSAALAAGLGVAAVRRGRGGSVAGIALALLLVALPLALHYAERDLSRSTLAADYGRDMLRGVDHNGSFFVEGDDSFIVAYLTQVLGERPDITVYDRSGTLFRDIGVEHGAPPAPGEGALAYRARRELERIAAAAAPGGAGEAAFMTWPGYELPPGLRFEPYGLVQRVRASAAAPLDDAALRAGDRARRVASEARRGSEPNARTVAAYYPLSVGERRLFEDDRDAAIASLDRAIALAGESEAIRNYVGTLYARMGDLPRAIVEFQAATEIRPLSVRAWNNLAQARWLSGDRTGARDAWRRSLSIDPAQPDARFMLEAASGY